MAIDYQIQGALYHYTGRLEVPAGALLTSLAMEFFKFVVIPINVPTLRDFFIAAADLQDKVDTWDIASNAELL
ncbi:hypothetical protein IMZ48_42605 [Candidatus Bathyarchaeota archaeon]|nr:hypothetical protein [Candidatus Bathyarchaeota archaeon]